MTGTVLTLGKQKVLVEVHIEPSGSYFCNLRFSPQLPKQDGPGALQILTPAQKVAIIVAAKLKNSVSLRSMMADLQGFERRTDDDEPIAPPPPPAVEETNEQI